MTTVPTGWRRPTDRPPIPNQQHETAAWVAWKNKRFGGHAASTVCGVNPYQTIDQLYDRLVHGIVDQKTAEEDAFLSWRLGMEPLIAERYCQEQDRTVRRRVSQYDAIDPTLVVNPDYEIVKIPERGVGLLELKSRDPMVWQQIRMKGAPGADWVQTQFYLMVSGLKWASICEANVSTGKQIVVDIDADLEFHGVLRDRIEAFLADCEAGRRPAPPVAVERLPEVGGELVPASRMDDRLIAEFAHLARANLTARDIFAKAEEFKTETDEQLKRWLRRHDFDVVEGFGGRFYYKEQAGRASFDKKALQRDHPEIDIKEYETRGEPFRTFKVYRRPESLNAADDLRAENHAALMALDKE